MTDINQVLLLGRLGRDPEHKATSNNPVANMSLVTARKWKDRDGNWQEKPTWHRIVAWGYLADQARDRLHKGDLVLVQGELETREWTDREGAKRTTTEVNARMLQLVTSPGGEGQRSGGYGGGGGGYGQGGGQSGGYGGGYGGGQQGGVYSPPSGQPTGGAAVPDDDDIPF